MMTFFVGGLMTSTSPRFLRFNQSHARRCDLCYAVYPFC